MQDRLTRQLEFIREIDKVKSVFRKTWLLDKSRYENDAEHAWHLAVLAAVLEEYAERPVDIAHVIRMVLVHDLVEIDAGDVMIYHEADRAGQEEKERAAADRIFALLPEDQARDFRALWDEFEARKTPEAIFARGLDRFAPILHNFHTQGRAWREHGVTAEQVRRINQPIRDASATLWQTASDWIDQAVANGWLIGP
ncbi:MAG: HD domain-containing protein [Phycisphaerae bacterium]